MAAPENRLAGETSPYLRQHRFDPVDWFPWGEEALERARELDRPLFLSIGYSACHWCHVMAHESFADADTAAQMNDTVVAVKVDREERPDLDAVYMEAVVAASGHGGWPMSVFATPDGRPFFAGTYFPDSPRHQMPSFRQVLTAVRDLWASRRSDVEAQANALSGAVASRLGSPPSLPGLDAPGDLRPTELRRADVDRAIDSASDRLAQIADPEHGGFGGAPKFPQPLLLDLLLRAHARQARLDGERVTSRELEIVLVTLEEMASGGIYDHIGGGFHRYSVDGQWTVPHFEKMLYDQVLLARVYLHAWQITGDEGWRRVLDHTLGYVLERLRHGSGALCAAEDADSEGEEGRFYVWEPGEIEDVLDDRTGPVAAAWFGAKGSPNFEGRHILVTRGHDLADVPPEIEHARSALKVHRAMRPPPGIDDKVLVEWNAMACSVLAEAAGATGNDAYGLAARRIMAVLIGARAANGGITPRLLRADEEPPVAGFAGDVAWMLEALVRLYELSGESAFLAHARDMSSELIGAFVDPSSGAVFTTRTGADPPVTRPVETTDGVIPSAASVSALSLARLGTLLGDEGLLETSAAIVGALSSLLEEAPTTVPELLWAADCVAGELIEIAAVGSGRQLLDGIRQVFLPTSVISWQVDETTVSEVALPLLEGRSDPGIYVCRAGVCRLPAHDQAGVARELAHLLS